jgi:hypothetical protein
MTPERRPPLTPALSGAELARWYWLKAELAGLARELGVPASGGKRELTARLVAVLDGREPPAPSPPPRAAPQLTGPLSAGTAIPPGQRCTQHLRAFFAAEVGPGFRFDGAMRAFIADGAGRTLGEAVEHWHATRDRPPGEIGEQFELNRFLRAFHAEHPAAGRAEALAAWRAHRAAPRS